MDLVNGGKENINAKLTFINFLRSIRQLLETAFVVQPIVVGDIGV